MNNLATKSAIGIGGLSLIAGSMLSLGAKAQTELPLSQVLSDEQAIIAAQPEGYNLVSDSIRTLDNESVEAILPGRVENPDNVKRVESVLSEADWDYLFPQRDPAYTYLNFLKAIGKYPAICSDYTDGRDADAICRKTLATMFAHFTQETGGHNPSDAVPEWRQGLYYLRELGWSEEMSGGYGLCDPNTWQGRTYPCGKNADGSNKSYFGRGSKQLSYNYNYGPFSASIYGNVDKLLNEPELVADTWLNLASAVFFYLYPQPPKPSMLHVIDGTWQPNQYDLDNGLVPGFGVTTQIINGGVECGGSEEHIQSQNRIDYYHQFADYLNVDIPTDEVLGCAGMKQFDANGAGALNIYWEEDWGWSPDTFDGRTYKCQLVAYQGPYSSFINGDYKKCVEDKFNVTVYDDINGNLPPNANAGADIIIDTTTTNKVTVSAAASSDIDGNIIAYNWQQVDDTGINLSVLSPNAVETEVLIPEIAEEATFTLQLTITDDDGSESSDRVNIVAKTQMNNAAPTVELIAPTEVDEGQLAVVVSADISDSDDDNFMLTWSLSNDIPFALGHDDRSIVFNAPDVDVNTPLTVSLSVIDSADNRVSTIATIVVINNDGNNTGNCDMSDPNAGNYAAYDPATIYTQDSDPVTHNGLVYQAKWWLQGNEPTPGNSAWDLLSNTELPWSADATYNGGDSVNYGEFRWQAKWWTRGDEPGVADVWENIGTSSCQ